MKKAAEAINRMQQRREKTSRDLLEAARRVIAFKGYHQTKIVDIARSANVGVGTFYLYYPTKQAIFLELVDDTVRKLKSELDRVRVGGGDPAELSRRSIETFVRFAQDNRELFRIVFSHEAGFHEVVRRAQTLFLSDSVENLRAGMEVGVFRKDDPEIVAQALIGMSISVVSWWLEHEGVSIEKVTKALTDIAYHGISCGIVPGETAPG